MSKQHEHEGVQELSQAEKDHQPQAQQPSELKTIPANRMVTLRSPAEMEVYISRFRICNFMVLIFLLAEIFRESTTHSGEKLIIYFD